MNKSKIILPKINFDEIPLDIFMNYILKYFSFVDICCLCMVSKSFNNYYSNSLIWKYFCRIENTKIFYPKKLKTLSHRYKNMKSSSQLKVPLVIINNSNIPFNLFWIKKNYDSYNSNKNNIIYKEINKGKPINPGDTQNYRSLENHYFMCVPTYEWFQENPYENVGFGFHINVKFLTEFEHKNISNRLDNSHEIKLSYVKYINQPKNLIPIHMKNPENDNYKHMFIRFILHKNTINHRIYLRKKDNDLNKQSIDKLNKSIEEKKKRIKYNNTVNYSLKYALKVYNYEK